MAHAKHAPLAFTRAAPLRAPSRHETSRRAAPLQAAPLHPGALHEAELPAALALAAGGAGFAASWPEPAEATQGASRLAPALMLASLAAAVLGPLAGAGLPEGLAPLLGAAPWLLLIAGLGLAGVALGRGPAPR